MLAVAGRDKPEGLENLGIGIQHLGNSPFGIVVVDAHRHDVFCYGIGNHGRKVWGSYGVSGSLVGFDVILCRGGDVEMAKGEFPGRICLCQVFGIVLHDCGYFFGTHLGVSRFEGGPVFSSIDDFHGARYVGYEYGNAGANGFGNGEPETFLPGGVHEQLVLMQVPVDIFPVAGAQESHLVFEPEFTGKTFQLVGIGPVADEVGRPIGEVVPMYEQVQGSQ